jgi:hypothetical protein
MGLKTWWADKMLKTESRWTHDQLMKGNAGAAIQNARTYISRLNQLSPDLWPDSPAGELEFMIFMAGATPDEAMAFRRDITISRAKAGKPPTPEADKQPTRAVSWGPARQRPKFKFPKTRKDSGWFKKSRVSKDGFLRRLPGSYESGKR